MFSRILKLHSKVTVRVISKSDFAKVEDVVYGLMSDNELKDGDVISFGSKSIRVNRKAFKIEDNKLIPIVIDNPNPLGKKNSKIRLSYRVDGDVAIFKTLQRNPVEFIVDKKDIEKVLEYRWSAHCFINGVKSIVYRYRDENGKWKELALSKHLFGKGYIPANGNYLDYRSCNMKKRKQSV